MADYVAMTEAPRRGDRRRMAFMLLTVLVYMREGGHNCFRQDPVGFNRILEQFPATVAFTSS